MQQRKRWKMQNGRASARPTRATQPTDADDELTRSLIESFPASDPPSWTPLIRMGAPKRRIKSHPAAERSRRPK